MRAITIIVIIIIADFEKLYNTALKPAWGSKPKLNLLPLSSRTVYNDSATAASPKCFK